MKSSKDNTLLDGNEVSSFLSFLLLDLLLVLDFPGPDKANISMLSPGEAVDGTW
jgi:hypothetical protein